MAILIEHLDLLWPLLGAQLTYSTKPVVGLITHGQIHSFLQKFIKLCFYSCGWMFVKAAKFGQSMPSLENRTYRSISQCSNSLAGLLHQAGSATGLWVGLGNQAIYKVARWIFMSSNGNGLSYWWSDKKLRASCAKPCHRKVFCLMSWRRRYDQIACWIEDED